MSRIQVAPAVMCWAGESIGLDVAQAARRIGVSVGVLEAWEEGIRSPTTRQLGTAARVYRRPTFVLMLAEPPTDFLPIRDCRRVGAPVMPYWPRAGIRRALEQLDFYHEISEHVPPVTAGLPMVTTSTGVEEAAQQIRDASPRHRRWTGHGHPKTRSVMTTGCSSTGIEERIRITGRTCSFAGVAKGICDASGAAIIDDDPGDLVFGVALLPLRGVCAGLGADLDSLQRRYYLTEAK